MSAPTDIHDDEPFEFAAIAGEVCLILTYITVHLIRHLTALLLMRAQNQFAQAPRRLLSPCRCRAPSAALRRSLANGAVALVAELGSRTVEMPTIHNLIIHGLRASRLVEVSCGDVTYFVTCNGINNAIETDWLL